MTGSPIFDALLDERWESLPMGTVLRWIADGIIARAPLAFTTYGWSWNGDAYLFDRPRRHARFTAALVGEPPYIVREMP